MVIMPVYNSEQTLSMAIESVLSQSYRNLRLVIVDDASTDKSLKIAKRYLDDDRVYIFHNNQNMGAYYSRNVGLDFIKNLNWGYFTTHDSDDVSYQHRYIKLIQLLKQPRNLAVQDTFRKVKLKTNQDLGPSLTMAHAVFKHEIFKRLGYFEVVEFGADWEYWQRMNSLIKHGRFTSASVREVMGDSFIHENNLTTRIPLNSKERKEYIKKTRHSIAQRVDHRSLYNHFATNQQVTRRIG